MKLHSLFVDEFLDDFAGWRRWSDTLEFKTELNPLDGVSYPLIHRDVPQWGIRQRLSAVAGRQVKIGACFLRLSPAGVPAPHQAHTDSIMGGFSLMVYLNRPEHCRGGTALVRHVSGMDCDPDTAEGVEIWKQDMNKAQKWHPYVMCEMKPNRAFVFKSSLMHRAEPIGGFGTTQKDARLVLTAFFDYV